MTEEIHERLGKHGAEISTLQTDMRDLKKDVRSILATLNEARGGWKTLMLVAGIAGAVGALFGKLATLVGLWSK